MNRERIESIRIRLRRDASSDFYGDRAVRVIEMADILDALLEADDQAPTPKVDSSLRGWVVSDHLDGDSVFWADENGLAEGVDMRPLYAWEDIDPEWTIRPLTPADVGGWSGDEIMDAVAYAWEKTPYDAEADAFRATARAALQDMRRKA